MPIIFLIRHAENDYVKQSRLAGRLPDIHLNEKGRMQAKALAERLKDLSLKAIYSSPLERAMETAEFIAEATRINVVAREGLLETDYGEWQGKTLKSLRRRKLWRTVQNAPSMARFPSGESFAECQVRVISEIAALCNQHKPKDMFACVFHADPIKLAVAYYLGMPLDNFQRLFVSPASVTALHISDSGSHLMTLNYDISLNFPKS